MKNYEYLLKYAEDLKKWHDAPKGSKPPQPELPWILAVDTSRLVAQIMAGSP